MHYKKNMTMLRSVLNVAKKRETKTRIPYIVYRRFLKGNDDIVDTKTLNLADVSSFSPRVINLLFRIVESESTLRKNFGFAARSSTRIKFAHISRQVEGLCEVFHVATNQPDKSSGKNKQHELSSALPAANNNLCYNLRLP